MNLVVAREPDKICWSDACPFGLGGYSLSGRAWRLCIPKTSPIFGHKGINNLLEFLGMAVNIWLACLESTGGSIASWRLATTRWPSDGSTTRHAWTSDGTRRGPTSKWRGRSRPC
jgi:hypothetical protein